MQIDELRGELVQLADEIGPFEGDVHALHRHERRHRVVMSAVAAGCVVVIGAFTAAAILHTGHGTSSVTVTGPKAVPGAELSHVDVIVVPASAAVEHVLASSSLVSHYAPVLPATRIGGPATPIGAAYCALLNSDGFAVQAATPGSDLARVLSGDLARRATVYDISDNIDAADIEVFLQVHASTRQTESVRAALTSDPDVRSFEELTKADAFRVFKQEFADQPELVQHAKPSDLPESFLITLKPGTSLDTTVGRYAHLGGVATILTPQATLHRWLFFPAAQPTLGMPGSRSCRAGKTVHP